MSAHQASLKKDRPVTDDDKRAGDVARQLHSMLQKVSMSALEAGAKNRVHAILILAQAASGMLHMLARTVMPDEDADEPINSTATLFAALLAYQTAPAEREKGIVMAEYSPLVVFDALKDVEKLIGQRPDDKLEEMMCKVARECAADPAMVAAIGRERSVLERGSATLN